MRCILYPGQKIIVVAPNKKQSQLFIKKCYEFKRESQNLCGEIEDIKTSENDSRITFFNGSEIQAAVCSENSRGKVLIASIYSNVNLKSEEKSGKLKSQSERKLYNNIYNTRRA